MKRVRFFLAAATLLILSCSSLGNTFNATPTPTDSASVAYPNCPDPQPTQKDIDFALQHGEEYFTSSDWKKSYSVMEYQVSVTWKNDNLGAMANFDHVIFCRATDPVLDNYYTDATFNAIFQNYDGGHEAQKDCRSGNLRLYEFKVKNNGMDYNARFWVEILDKDHVRQSLLVFPITDTVNLDSYSKTMMPKLPVCE